MLQKPLTILALGLGVSVAAVAFVGIFLWMETPAEEEGPRWPDAPAGQRLPAEADLRDVGEGLQIGDLVEGTGGSPVRGQTMKIHYSGWLSTTGVMFDSSIERGQPLAIALETGPVIPGWHKGIAGMKVGGKRQLVIPPELAYGAQGRPPVIPPNSTLIFEVELIEIGEIRLPPDQPQRSAADPAWQMLAKNVKSLDLMVGSGQAAGERSVVEAEITVWKPDGTVFFSSWNQERGLSFMAGAKGPGSAPLEGIDIGVRGMMPGGSRYLELPPEVAFGERGFRDQVPPNATVWVQVDAKSVSAPRIAPPRKPAFDLATATTTASGLKYVDVEVGTGATPAAGDMVVAEYTGWLDSGAQFDSSFNGPDAFSFPLGRGAVIAAWDEALATMKVGGKRIIVAPPDLAYGERGSGSIPPNATLTFEIQLVDVKAAPPNP